MIILWVAHIKLRRTVIVRQTYKNYGEVVIKGIREKLASAKNKSLKYLTRMKYKMNSFFIILLLIVVFYKTIVTAQPLDYDTASNLLPVEPQDVNETIAAVVIDPVVKDAVKHVANNGSLNGLMVRRKVIVMPVNNPQTIISERDQILTVPPEHLEDVRKNITNSTEEESQVNEFALAEKIPLFGGYGYVNETNLHSSETTPDDLELNNDPYEDMQNSNLCDANTQSPDETSQLPFVPQTTATDQNLKTATVPILAVIDSKNINNGKAQTPIVAILPNPVKGEILKTEVHFLNKNEAEERIEQNAIVISSENWSSMSTLPETVQTTHAIEDEKVFITTLLPNPEIVPSIIVETDNIADYADDMDVAEDIIFRPLFRYRQEAAQRARYREEENNYRRTNYQRRKPYAEQDYYPRRNYRYRPQSNYDDYE